MKLFRFIRRYKDNDWLQVIMADSLEEAISLYDFKDDKDIECEEMEQRKGPILAFHITKGQAGDRLKWK